MSLWDDIQPWIDKETGLMTAPDGGRDNLILMTAYLTRELGETPTELMTSIMTFAVKAQVASGLWLRKPGDFSQNSVDNLIGICALSSGYAVGVRIRWERFWSCFDVTAPYRVALNSNFYGRFLGLKTFIDAAVGHTPSFSQRLIWIAANYFTDWTAKGASDRLLMSLQVDTMRKHCPKTCARWDRRNPLYPLYFEYFGGAFPLTVARRMK